MSKLSTRWEAGVHCVQPDHPQKKPPRICGGRAPTASPEPRAGPAFRGREPVTPTISFPRCAPVLPPPCSPLGSLSPARWGVLLSHFSWKLHTRGSLPAESWLSPSRLGLKDQQEREIVHVLVDCCLQEKAYNPFYAFLAGKLCGHERRFQVMQLEGQPPVPMLQASRVAGRPLGQEATPIRGQVWRVGTGRAMPPGPLSLSRGEG